MRVTVNEEVCNNDDIQGSDLRKIVTTSNNQQQNRQQITLFSSNI
ncbi:MAG TPA: hypothetical protein VFT71_01455 [Candidatus Nitrosocosmicus sp.]|nr:hypothetical protein [Candidatus Nitrosocosmicus sp.]